MRVTGSEIVGLIPKRVLIDAAHHYLRKQNRASASASRKRSRWP